MAKIALVCPACGGEVATEINAGDTLVGGSCKYCRKERAYDVFKNKDGLTRYAPIKEASPKEVQDHNGLEAG